MKERKQWEVIDFYYQSGYEKGFKEGYESHRHAFSIGRKSIDNHKGEPCPYKEILCQEGYCSECQVYLDYIAWCKSLFE